MTTGILVLPLPPLPFDPWRRDHHAVSKRRTPITQWRGATSQKNGDLEANITFETLLLSLHSSKTIYTAYVWDSLVQVTGRLLAGLFHNTTVINVYYCIKSIDHLVMSSDQQEFIFLTLLPQPSHAISPLRLAGIGSKSTDVLKRNVKDVLEQYVTPYTKWVDRYFQLTTKYLHPLAHITNDTRLNWWWYNLVLSLDSEYTSKHFFLFF